MCVMYMPGPGTEALLFVVRGRVDCNTIGDFHPELDLASSNLSDFALLDVWPEVDWGSMESNDLESSKSGSGINSFMSICAA